MRKLLTIYFVFIFSNSSFAEDKAEVNLQKMLDKYVSLISYEDSGNSITEFTKSTKSTNKKYKNELNFKTKYRENESLHFEWLDIPNEIGKNIKNTTWLRG